MIDLSVQNIKKAFEQGTDILKGVSFDVNQGEHIGLLGRNGAGKTTLFKIITGELQQDEGSVTIAPGKRIGVLSQIPEFPAGYTGEDVLTDAQQRVIDMGDRMRFLEKRMEQGVSDAETMREYDNLSAEFQRLGGYELKRFRDEVANGLGIPTKQREQPFAELSGGEQTRLNLARLLLDQTDILLLDEPTNHLDMSAAQWLETYLVSFKGTALVISHDRYFLDQVVTRVIEITGGVAEFYGGNYTFYLDEKRRRFEEKLRRYEKEQAKIRQLQKAADDLHLWAFMGADKLHKRAFSMEKRIERLNVTERPRTEAKVKARFEEAEFHGDEVLLMRGVSKAFGEKRLFEAVDLLMERGERVAVIGNNGTGKSTLVKLLMGELEPDEGFLRLGPSVRTAYLPQRVSFLNEDETVLECMMEEARCTRQQAYDRLAAFLFRGEELETRVSQLSGGEKSRLKLCILMRGDVNLLVLDEPTNHLDADSREWIEDALAGYGEALLFVSHDRYFISRFATRIWELADGQLHDYRCGYDRYLALQERRPHIQPEIKERPEREKKRPQVNRERELSKLERSIAALEKQVEENGAKQEAAATDYEKLMELGEERNQLEDELSALYERWEKLV